MSQSKFFLTTPIYYVNDQPHVGHLYTTIIADIAGRYHRLLGEQVVFSTGTDEHATKVTSTAQARGLTARDWADTNARAFRNAFEHFDVQCTDFIRTSEARHVSLVQGVCARLIASSDFYLGAFEGWYDEGQEEYVPEARAEAIGFCSSVTGKPLVRRREDNYFFRLSRWAAPIEELITSRALEVTPESRREEVLARLRQGVHDVPVSRRIASGWGVTFPGAPDHVVYVWVDALLNYLTVARSAGAATWPPNLHLVGKEILWFHAVLWPALLLALSAAGEPLALPKRIHAHSHWVRDGQKMSKSLGNFVDLTTLEKAAADLGTDAIRYFFAAQGPLRATDADFSLDAVRRVYQAELANGIGNCVARVSGVIKKYFDGRLPSADPSANTGLHAVASGAVDAVVALVADVELDKIVEHARLLVREVNRILQQKEPHRLALDPSQRTLAGAILNDCVQTLHIAVGLLSPVLLRTASEVRRRFGQTTASTLPSWGEVSAGTPILDGPVLFPRVDDLLTEREKKP